MPEIFDAMQAAKLGMDVVKFGTGFISKIKLSGDLKRMDEKIREIQSEAVKLGDKVANAHFHSALISLDNIRMGNDAKTEMRAAIHHLYDAYNVEHDLLDTKLTFDQYLFCNKTAALISALHLYLDEPEIANQWRERAEEAYGGATAIYNNEEEFQKKIFSLIELVIPAKDYFKMVHSCIAGTYLRLFRIITEGQYIAFGPRYTYMDDFRVGIGPFKKSLMKAYFLTPRGHQKVLDELNKASERIQENYITTMIEIQDL